MMILKTFVIIIISYFALEEGSLFIFAKDNNPLEGRSFRIKSSIKTNLYNKDKWIGYKEMSQLIEEYSFEQSRGNIHFTLLNRDNTLNNDESIDNNNKNNKGGEEVVGKFQFDTKKLSRFLYNYNTGICQYYPDLIKFQKLIYFKLPISLDDTKLVPDYIIGPARLLFFSISNRDRMKLTSLKPKHKVRNIPCLEYSFEIQTATEGIVTFTALYSELSLAIDPNSLPLYISLGYGRNKVLVFEYWELEYLYEDYLEDYQLLNNDLFLSDLSENCTKALIGNVEEFIFSHLMESKTKFSFQAQVEYTRSSTIQAYNNDLPSKRLEFFIAYDSSLNSFKIEKSTTLDQTSYSTNEVMETKKQLFNFKTNRMYFIKEIFNKNKYGEKILDLDTKRKTYDDNKTTMKCVVTKISSNKSACTVGELLVGSNSFVYMGKAMIRGIKSLVYKISSQKYPFWLGQLVEYIQVSRSDDQSKGMLKVRLPEVGIEPNVVDKNSITIYVTDDTNNSANDKNERKFRINRKFQLLHMEILKNRFNIDSDYYDKIIIDFYDFIWSLPIETTNGESLNDLFSIKDLCNSTPYHKRIINNNYQLLLEQRETISNGSDNYDDDDNEKFIFDDPIYKNVLFIPVQRNLAILTSLHNYLEININTVYDLESKLISKQQTQQQTESLFNIDISFKSNEETKLLTNLYYLGKGFPNISYNGIKIIPFIETFRSCFLEASSYSYNIYFAYDLNRMKCYIDIKNVASISSSNKQERLNWPTSFSILSKNSTTISYIEIYRTEHFVEDRDVTFDNKLINGELLDKQIKLEDSNFVNENILTFTVKRFLREVSRDGNENTSSSNEQTDNYLYGVGFYTSTINNNEPHSIVDKTNFDNSNSSYIIISNVNIENNNYDQCQAACLSDFNCKSFSFCSVSELEKSSCSLTSLDLTSEFISRIQSNLNRIKRFTKIFKMNINDNDNNQDINKGEIEFLKHPSCQLRRKSNLDLFVESKEVKMIELTGRVLFGMNNIDECAKRCMDVNLKVLKQNENNIDNLVSKLTSNDISLWKDVMNQHKQVSRELCDSINFISHEQYLNVPKELKNYIKLRTIQLLEAREEKFKEFLNYGYCLVGSRILKDEQEYVNKMILDDNNNHYTAISKKHLSEYLFNTNLFYIRMNDISLKASIKSESEEKAYKQVLIHNIANEASYSIMKLFLERMENSQSITISGQFWCAYKCFTHLSNIWPACKSFDIVIKRDSKRQVSYCQLNTVTLYEMKNANKLDLIESTSNVTIVDDDNKDEIIVERIHFEPKKEYALIYSDLNSLIEIKETEEDEKKLLSLEKEIRIQPFGIFILILFSIVLGFIAGILIGRKFHNCIILQTNKLFRVSNGQDQQVLVSINEQTQRVVRFSKQVNYLESVK